MLTVTVEAFRFTDALVHGVCARVGSVAAVRVVSERLAVALRPPPLPWALRSPACHMHKPLGLCSKRSDFCDGDSLDSPTHSAVPVCY